MSPLSTLEEEEGRVAWFSEMVREDAPEGAAASPAVLSQQVENSFVSLYQVLSLLFTAWCK